MVVTSSSEVPVVFMTLPFAYPCGVHMSSSHLQAGCPSRTTEGHRRGQSGGSGWFVLEHMATITGAIHSYSGLHK